MPAWPSSLPQYPLREGFSDTAPETVIRSKPETGPNITRRRFTAGQRRITCTIKLANDTAKAALETFFNTDVAGGSLSFTWAAMSTLTGGGTGNFRFAAPPEYGKQGATRVPVKLTLVREPA